MGYEAVPCTLLNLKRKQYVLKDSKSICLWCECEKRPVAKNIKAAYDFVVNKGVKYSIVIDADKKPKDEHLRKWNAPECEEISVLLPFSTEIHKTRDIIIPYNHGELELINEFSPAYDCLQYPLMFPNGNTSFYRPLYYEKKIKNQTYKTKKLTVK